MLREVFIEKYLKYLRIKADTWLPEEDSELEMLNIMRERIDEHSKDIRVVLESKQNGAAG